MSKRVENRKKQPDEWSAFMDSLPNEEGWQKNWGPKHAASYAMALINAYDGGQSLMNAAIKVAGNEQDMKPVILNAMAEVLGNFHPAVVDDAFENYTTETIVDSITKKLKPLQRPELAEPAPAESGPKAITSSYPPLAIAARRTTISVTARQQALPVSTDEKLVDQIIERLKEDGHYLGLLKSASFKIHFEYPKNSDYETLRDAVRSTACNANDDLLSIPAEELGGRVFASLRNIKIDYICSEIANTVRHSPQYPQFTGKTLRAVVQEHLPPGSDPELAMKIMVTHIVDDRNNFDAHTTTIMALLAVYLRSHLSQSRNATAIDTKTSKLVTGASWQGTLGAQPNQDRKRLI